MIYVTLATKLKKTTKKKRKLFVNPYIHMLPEKRINDICGISYKTRKLQKNVFMIYAYVIHTCLDVALATKLENYKKMYP